MSWDRYAYANNSPIRFNDPNGHDVGCTGTSASNCSGYNQPIHSRTAYYQFDLKINVAVDIGKIETGDDPANDQAINYYANNGDTGVQEAKPITKMPEAAPNAFGVANYLLGPGANANLYQQAKPDLSITIHIDANRNSDPNIWTYQLKGATISNGSSQGFYPFELRYGSSGTHRFSGKVQPGQSSFYQLPNNSNISPLGSPFEVNFIGRITSEGDPWAGIRGGRAELVRDCDWWLHYVYYYDKGGSVYAGSGY